MLLFEIENFPPTINSYPECNQIVVDAATKIVGVQRASIAQKTMISEDFSFFLTARPGTYDQTIFLICNKIINN